VLCGTFSPDGRWIATSGQDRSVRVFDVQTRAELTQLTGFAVPARSVAFSPDRQRMVTSEAKLIRLWDVQSLREVLTLDRHEREITSVSFSPSGRDVLSASLDGMTIIWPGTDIEPAVAFSLAELKYSEPSTPVFLDEQATVRMPSSRNMGDVTLTCRIAGQAETPPTKHEWLEIGKNPVEGIDVQDGGSLLFDNGEELIDFATITQRGNGTQPLQVALNDNATGETLKALVRSVTYRNDAALSAEQTRAIEVTFVKKGVPRGEDGDRGGSAPAKVVRIIPTERAAAEDETDAPPD
jgi:hypothetical protein